MALAVGDINSVWPLLCAAREPHVHSTQFGSSMSLDGSRLTRFWTRQPPTWQKKKKRCGWWEAVKGENKMETKQGESDSDQKCEGQKILTSTEKNKWPWIERRVGGGSCAVLLALSSDTALCHAPVNMHQYHMWVNNMNKTDGIKTGCSPLPPSCCWFSALRKKDTQGQQMMRTPISCVLSLSCCCCSSFHLSPLHLLAPLGCEASLSTRGWSVQTQKAVQRRGAGGTHAIIKLEAEGCTVVKACVLL